MIPPSRRIAIGLKICVTKFNFFSRVLIFSEAKILIVCVKLWEFSAIVIEAISKFENKRRTVWQN